MRQLTIQKIMLITLFILIFILSAYPPVDTDTWWHLTSGDYTLNEGMIYQDPFSHTKNGDDWINHSWGAQIILLGAWEIAGNVGLALYTAILAVGGMAMIYPICKGNTYIRAFALIFAAMIGTLFWSARPHMFSFFFSASTLYILYSYKYNKVDRLWLLPPLLMLWVNLHAGFSMAFILIFGVLTGEVAGNIFNRGGEDVIPFTGIKKIVLVTIVSILFIIINPYTFKMLAVPFETIGMQVLRDYIQEWRSPDFHQRHQWLIIFLLFATIGATGMSKNRLDWTDYFLLIGTSFMSFYAARNAYLFALVAAPILSKHIDYILEEHGWTLTPITRVTPLQLRINWILLSLIILGAVIYIGQTLSPSSIKTAQQNNLPVKVADFIKEERIPGTMFNEYGWGGYFIFALPDYPVFADGRTDLYRDEFLQEYLIAYSGGKGWENTLEKYHVNSVVVDRQSGIANVLATHDGWTLIYPTDRYEDDRAVIYTRNN